jgi:hypothetical protein
MSERVLWASFAGMGPRYPKQLPTYDQQPAAYPAAAGVVLPCTFFGVPSTQHTCMAHLDLVQHLRRF